MLRRALVTVSIFATTHNAFAQRSVALPSAPSRSEVGDSMREAQARVRRCSPPLQGVANVFVTFGSNGSVRSVAFGLDSERDRHRVDMGFLSDTSAPLLNTRPGFASSTIGRCVLAEVATSRVAAFSRAHFVVQYAFSL